MPKDSIETVQDTYKEHLQMQMRTDLSADKYNKISCVVILTNKVTGKLDVISANAGLNLINDVKGLLYAALDQLKRIQITTAITGFLLSKGKKEEEKK